ncbi:MAG: PP2C family protein-serine/threonine phosphatase [Bacteroidota bacterium]
MSVAIVRSAEAAAGEPPPLGLAMGMDVIVVLAVAVGYVALITPRSGSTAPHRLLWTPFLIGLGVLAAEAVTGWLHEGAIDPKTALPADLETAVVASAVGLIDTLLSLAILVSLRPLVLYRRRRAIVTAWGLLLVLGLAAALTFAGRPLDEYGPNAMLPFLVGAVLVGTGLSARQSWVSALTFRERMTAAFLALGVAVTLGALIYIRIAGPALLPVGDGTGEVASVPYTAALSRPLGVVVLLTTAFGGLYAFAGGLWLLFGLPGADVQDQRVGERRALRSLADLSGRLLDRSALAAAIARGPVEAGFGDAAWVALTDPPRGVLTPTVVAAEGIGTEAAAAATDAAALARAATDADGPLVLAHAAADHRVRTRPGDGVGSLVVLPLAQDTEAGGLTRGALFIARRLADAFEADDLAALDTFAGQAGLSLSHADLFADALERERLARELALAREVQQRLLPQSLPEVEGVQIAAAERPAREVGGDYYDAVRLGDDCVGLLVADVSGKGAAAAFYMAEMKGIFQAGSRLTRAPGEFLAQANDALSASLGRGDFVSASYAVLDAEAGTLAVARAGHTPAVLVRDRSRRDGGRWLLRGDGLAIGLDRTGTLFRQTLREQTVALAPGDTVVLYTDGLVEARDANGEEYGYDRLLDFVARHAHVDALDLRDLLLAEHRSWAGSDEAEDDTTFVVVRWTGRGETVPVADLTDGPPLTERPAFASA